ncbi:calnexin isoform X1 [Pieris brassicae]|uniref:calnexin isoform X1 n=2 Tax=Pieris brassicae TaxID=7116 RepID=UPI001E65F1B4|nr:calnexin isoform X1 [Pieris brassicae]
MSKMALLRFVIASAFIVLAATSSVHAEAENLDDGVTVETVEEDSYQTPQIDSKKAYLAEHFDDEEAFKKKWVKSETKKQGVDDTIAKYDGKWELQTPARRLLKDDFGLVLTTEAKHAAISALLNRPFVFSDKPLIVQYEVTMQEGQNCGGAYLKLLSKGVNTRNDLKQFHDQTPYTIMFGPDKCGNDNKLHFIFKHQNPKNGTIEEKHAKKPTQRLDDIYKDKEPHLYTLIVRPDNTFTILVDNKEVNSGSLLEDFTPAVNPPEEIDDPNDRKPEDWDEREKIVDPTATKPEDWDEDAPAQIVDPSAVKPTGWLDNEPEMIPDPDAVKPSDWEDEMDGEWEAPLVDNPLCSAAPGCGEWKAPLVANPSYKGVWRAPLIPNPNYKGKWTPRRIPNPHYFNDEHPFRMTTITAVGFELWSMSPQLLFDNLIITDDEEVAAEWARQTYTLKRDRITSQAKTIWGKILTATQYKPGYWAMYALYSAVPVTLYIVYLLGRSREQELEVEDVKKTDAVVEDDPHQSDEEREEEKTDESAEKEKQSKADLEGPDDTKESAPLIDTEGAGDGQRKRKPRKE